MNLPGPVQTEADLARVREWLLVGAGALLLVALACSGSDSTGPSAAPPLGTIAFVSARDGNQEIYVMNADGSGVSRLTNTPATDIDPAWSPDGRRIAFASDGDGTHRIYDIYVMNADGSGVTRLTNDPVTAWGPAWSPDGTKIAFESYRDGNGEIYVMNPDGSAVTNLTHDPADDAWPAWSPDGAKIAFARENESYKDEIYVMSPDGSGVTRLSDSGREPAWKP